MIAEWIVTVATVVIAAVAVYEARNRRKP